jgi:hypothetical protein
LGVGVGCVGGNTRGVAANTTEGDQRVIFLKDANGVILRADVGALPFGDERSEFAFESSDDGYLGQFLVSRF